MSASSLQNVPKENSKKKYKKIKKSKQCDVCGFISLNLSSHMQVHRVEDLECDMCGKKFTLRDSLKNHLFLHLNIR